jgi:hypothetical protein
MDRVFSRLDQTPTARPPAPVSEIAVLDVEVRDGVHRLTPRGLGDRLKRRRWALAGGCGLGLLLGGSLLLSWHGWQQAAQDLREERTLRMLEGLRTLGPPSSTNRDPAAASALPPPPPSEPWIEELNQLSGGTSANAAAPLRVPLHGTLNAPLPAPTVGATGGGGGDDIPQLLGVVQIPGRPGSAILQLGGSSSNALVGERIGNSGWRLVSTAADSVVIERGGLSRRLSLSGGF